MAYKIGFIGCGNMASGIINGVLKSGIPYGCINLYDIDSSKTDIYKHIRDIKIKDSAAALADASDFIFLCVKPNNLPDVLNSIKSKNKAYISIAAGVKLDVIKEMINDKRSRFMRIMPNMPLKVGEGAICIADNYTLNSREFEYVTFLYASIGKYYIVSENEMDAVTAISGSGPAYVFYIMDSIAKAGEEIGMDYKTALELAKQTFIGSIKMIEDDSDLGELCESICSKGGTTIEAIDIFRKNKLDEIIKEGIVACRNKSVKLSEN